VWSSSLGAPTRVACALPTALFGMVKAFLDTRERGGKEGERVGRLMVVWFRCHFPSSRSMRLDQVRVCMRGGSQSTSQSCFAPAILHPS